MAWNFAKLQKQSLGFIVVSSGTYVSVTQKEKLCLKLKTEPHYRTIITEPQGVSEFS